MRGFCVGRTMTGRAMKLIESKGFPQGDKSAVKSACYGKMEIVKMEQGSWTQIALAVRLKMLAQ